LVKSSFFGHLFTQSGTIQSLEGFAWLSGLVGLACVYSLFDAYETFKTLQSPMEVRQFWELFLKESLQLYDRFQVLKSRKSIDFDPKPETLI
jgi:hypothetical protein